MLLARLGPAYVKALDANGGCSAGPGRPTVARSSGPRATASSSCSRAGGGGGGLARALGNLAGVEETLEHYERAEALTREALGIVEELRDVHELAVQGQNLAYLLAISGRVDEATLQAESLVDPVLQLRSPTLTIALAHRYMDVLLRTGDLERAAMLYGAEASMRERLAMPNPHAEQELQGDHGPGGSVGLG